MDITIRRATSRDADALCTLNREFNGVGVPSEWIAKSLSAPGSAEQVFVAVYDENVVGFCCIELAQSFCYVNSRAEITELFVTAPYRAKGIARSVIAAAMRVAEERSRTEVSVRTNKANDVARALFASLGFVDGGQVMYRRETGPAGNQKPRTHQVASQSRLSKGLRALTIACVVHCSILR